MAFFHAGDVGVHHCLVGDAAVGDRDAVEVAELLRLLAEQPLPIVLAQRFPPLLDLCGVFALRYLRTGVFRALGRGYAAGTEGLHRRVQRADRATQILAEPAIRGVEVGQYRLHIHRVARRQCLQTHGVRGTGLSVLLERRTGADRDGTVRADLPALRGQAADGLQKAGAGLGELATALLHDGLRAGEGFLKLSHPLHRRRRLGLRGV
ncbi:hypothetical protein BN975_02797 [Mycolicibacterium farcinogenes]|uniref:hypothetical protein n=1 Tax=Mycolicibacterium farcinogenes TaxID=1802 RepID=UPI000457C0A0|nr:hypothetical protein [Mycolicibacterium farcinogenes]CDP86252.1 hypothetical protein BN975_02797 [Mycolicibacterium farcinogenes]